MPKLPSQGMFAIDGLLEKPSPLPGTNLQDLPIVWQWKDDRSQWHPYSPMDCRIIEVCFMPRTFPAHYFILV